MKSKITYLLSIGMMMFMLISTISINPMEVLAEGNVQEITISPSYRHPVSGVVADTGGEESYATGQGMVEGAVGTSGKLEQLESGSYELTITMSLIDFTSEHTFAVQESLEQSWEEVESEVVATGTDSNGTTQDFKIVIPEQSSIVRCEMYVEPMGRRVTFFIIAGDYIAENGLTEITTDEAVAGVTFSTDEKSNTQQVQSTDTKDKIDMNQILYLVVIVLLCAIIGVLIWNLKISKQQKQQEQLWEKEDES